MLADLDIRHLLALRAVADEGTFGRAADRLGFTQSAVSQQIAALERLVGMQLFDRPGGPRPPMLTPAGHTLLGHARTVLDQLDRAVDELDRLRRGVSGTLTVGAFQSITVKALPAVVGRFRADVPDVELRIVQSDVQAELLDRLERGDIDLLFVVGDVDPRFDVVPLGRDPYVALLPAHAPEGPYDITTLSGTPTVGQPADDVCQVAVVRALDRLGISPNYVFRSVDNSAVQSMVRSGMGPAIMPFLCVDPLDPSVSVRELDPAIEPRTIGIASVRGRTTIPAADQFVETTRSVCSELLDLAP